MRSGLLLVLALLPALGAGSAPEVVDLDRVCALDIWTGRRDLTQEARDAVPADVPLTTNGLAGSHVIDFALARPFRALVFDLTIPSPKVHVEGAWERGELRWSYWNGEVWADLPIAADGTDEMHATGRVVLDFDPPRDWAQTPWAQPECPAGPQYVVRAHSVRPYTTPAVADRVGAVAGP